MGLSRALARLERNSVRASENRLASWRATGATPWTTRIAGWHIKNRTRLVSAMLRRTTRSIDSRWRIYCADVVRPGDVVFDLGANMGRVTQFLSVLTGPRGEVHSFEPSPSLAGRLRGRCDALRLANVRVCEVALGDAPGTATLHEYRERDGGASSLRPNPELGYELLSETTVEIITVDDYVDAEGIEELRLIKIDVEGHEPEVLAGASATIERFRPVMIVEVSRHTSQAYGRDPRVLTDAIRELGYSMYSWRREGLVEVRSPDDIPDNWRHDDVLCLAGDAHDEIARSLRRRGPASRQAPG